MQVRPDLYAVILAGGGGTRLWPLSRLRKPKHLLRLRHQDTLLAQTVSRVRPLVPPDRVLAITVADHVDQVRGELAEVPLANIVVEPEGRSTAPCVALMALIIQQRDPDAVMISLHADHTVEDEEGFRSVLHAAVEAAGANHLVTLGIVPTCPETGYGYIQRAEPMGQLSGHDMYRVEAFTEKPDLPRACAFVESGCYFWNSGIFIWKVSAILAETQRLLPELYGQLMEIKPALGTPQQAETIARVWQRVRSVSVDVGIMERAKDVVVIPADVGWSDVGCWTSVADLGQADQDGNMLEGEHVVLDCQDTLVYSSGRLVAALGLKGMVIVETGDAVLVCPKDRVQDVRRIVDQLKREGRDKYL
ncbi:MAG: mannose-1-phosphate guanylyltransferase [Chloroflexi bacterium]|nr:mannose-1-phosphate guanylyltransferase [Chloroflexota bacterium]